MTPGVMRFVQRWKLSGKTLDIGCLDVNGSVRHLFTDYTGVDMRPGPNVDQVVNAHDLPFDADTFDNVLCLEMLEHDTDFFRSVSEMKRVLKPGGRLVITTRGIYFPKHDHPSDYWRFTPDALQLLLGDMEGVVVKEDAHDHGIYAYAEKPTV